MKNLLVFLFFLISISVQGEVIEEFFLNTPDSILPYFKHDSRELLLKFTEEDKDTLSSQSNELGGKVWLSHKSERLIMVHTSSMSELQYAMIPNENDTLFCLIKTEYAPEAESSLYIYNKVWELQNTVDIAKYSQIQFPDTLSQSERSELLNMIEMKMCSAKILPDAPDMLVVTQNLPTLSTEEKRRFDACELLTKVKIKDILQK